MESFIWGSHFETDIREVDDQHKRLVVLINNFGERMLQNILDNVQVEKTFQALVEYSQYHFKEEEELMATMQLDSRHTDGHLADHQNFLKDVKALSTEATESSTGCHHLHQYLIHWLAYHILGLDKNMARQIKSVKAGSSPEAAFNRGEMEVNAATEPLLAAVSSLFAQVSERNRELKELNRSLEEKVHERTKELLQANEQLEHLALTDALTGLPNRRHAMRQLRLLWDEAKNENVSLCCLMIDADGFKEVNDTWGHDAGDIVLQELAQALTHHTRTDDLTCRLGGDEFLVICPETDRNGGMHLGEMLRSRVADLRVPAGDGCWYGSISIGLGVMDDTMSGIDDLLKTADEGVYVAKRDGRNCVRTAQHPQG